jgi:hypothetical protein
MKRGRSLILVLSLAALALLATWLWPRTPETRSGRREAAGAPAREAEGTARPPLAAALPQRPELAPHEIPRPVPARPSGSPPEAQVGGEAPVGGRESEALISHLARQPLSEVPHQVLSAWGGVPEAKGGTVGLVAVVDPHLPTADLERLVRDIREDYAGAAVVSVRIFDSEEAATYPQHLEGSTLARRHLVADLTRNAALDLDTIRIRGILIDP